MDHATLAEAPTTGSAESRRRPRRLVWGAAALTAVLIAGSAVWFHTMQPTASADEGSTFDGATEEITLGDLEGRTAVVGTLRYSDSGAIHSSTSGTVTELPAAGSVRTRGDRLYSVDDVPVFLLRGEVPAWRDFASGMDRGRDVQQLEENLRDLGYFSETPDDRFGWATTDAIVRWQKALGLHQSGTLPLGSVVFAPSDLRVSDLVSPLGSLVGPGTALYNATTTTQVVEANVKLADQQLAAIGTPVTVDLPGGASTTGQIASVGTPTEIDGTNGQKQTVIPVVINLDDPTQSEAFQQASVTVGIPSEKREQVLSVPVGALMAITGEKFGVEVVHPGGKTTLVPVTLGLFAGGRVEISGDGISAGDRVVVPQR